MTTGQSSAQEHERSRPYEQAEESDEESPTYQRLHAAARYLDYLAPDGKGYINFRHGRKKDGRVNPKINEFIRSDAIEDAAIRAE